LECRGGGMQIPIGVNGGADQWVRLDTGCATALEWVASTATAGRCPGQIAVALMGFSRPMIQTRLRIGRTELDSVPAGVHAHEIFTGESGLAGNGLLSRFAAVTIDTGSGRLILDQHRPIAD